MFDAGIRKSHRLPRPVISVGNLTTGGTGKTPMVRWLASYLRDAGRHVAILSRGYKSAGGAMGDEQLMLDRMLNAPGAEHIILKPNPSRLAAAEEVLCDHPQTDLFILDDGFQHRTVARDLDIVLLNATEPFGLRHVLPRGFLREPRKGLCRAGAIVITHADRVSPQQLAHIELEIRTLNLTAPIYRAIHAPCGLRTATASSAKPPDRSMDDLRATRFFAFCGIGSPQLFNAQLKELGETYAGSQWFPDHHRYSQADLDAVRAQARSAGANVLVTTEKDWIKVSKFAESQTNSPEIWRLDVTMEFMADHESHLRSDIRRIAFS